jgi:hypothetical protein
VSSGQDDARRPLLAPEVLQASALDCGPAALASLLAGFGLERRLDELRDACRTGRDGTSIDALEAVASEMGLAAEQVLVPPDHLWLPEAACVPCILVVRQPGGAAHFVVLWRLHGRRAQLMDPAGGRRWPGLAALDREVHRHRAVVPASAWRAWAASEEGLRSLGARLGSLGVVPAERQALLRAAAGAPGWRPLAALDAAVRFVRRLVDAGGVRCGGDAARLLAALLDRAATGNRSGGAPVLPAGCWTVRAVPGAAAAGEGGERVSVEGAVLVRVRIRPPTASQAAAARASVTASPGQQQARDLAGDEVGAIEGRPAAGGLPHLGGDAGGRAVVVLASALGAAGRLAETVLLVAAFELLASAPSRRLGLTVLATLLALAIGLLGIEGAGAAAGAALGRRRESGLRLRLAAKLPRLADHYLRTRLLSDLAERAQSASATSAPSRATSAAHSVHPEATSVSVRLWTKLPAADSPP